MAKLAAWSIDRQGAERTARPVMPREVERSSIGLEKDLEDWIVRDAGLIGEGLTLVGRQVRIDDGILDLLALDTQDRWVVIEIKPDMLQAAALTQALYYASSIARIEADDLRERLEDGLGALGDARQLSARLERQLSGEADRREIAVLLVGAGIHPGLERMTAFLGRFGVPIGIVSFGVFELDAGPQLLVREVVDEQARPSRSSRFSVDAVRERADRAGVGEQFDRFESIARGAGLAVQPHKLSVRIAPPSNRTRMLIWAAPGNSSDGGRIDLEVNPECFAEFFPGIDEQEATHVLGGRNRASLGGSGLDRALDRLERFLNEKVRDRSSDAG